jgi:hypothetical protein
MVEDQEVNVEANHRKEKKANMRGDSGAEVKQAIGTSQTPSTLGKVTSI